MNNDLLKNYGVAGAAVVIVVAIGAYSWLMPAPMGSPTAQEQATSTPQATETKPVVPKPVGTGSQSATVTPTAPTPTTPQPTTPTPAPTTPTPTTPAPNTPTPAPTPSTYNPGFLASARVTPEIPSENERATLPACDAKLFTIDPVNLGSVSSITTNGELALFKLNATGQDNKYDLVAPGDVWITHIAQETGVTADPEDTTLYFALCRDVVAYVTHIKELSNASYKLITDSSCLGKPHTGPSACQIKVLELVSRGSNLGKVGRVEGSFGIGLIDLRKVHANASASATIRANYATCPFGYFTAAQNMFAKLTGSSTLCTAP